MVFLIWLFLLTGCSYHMGTGYDTPNVSIHVPYVKGDQKGLLTQEIIRALATESSFPYSEEKSAEWILKVEILEKEDGTIGYEHVQAKHEPKKSVIPIEGRINIKAKMTIEDKEANLLFGPYIVLAYTDYDFVQQDSYQDLSFVNTQGQREEVLSFSLGQLDSLPSAQEAALKPLFRKLAEKIVQSLPKGSLP